MSESRRARATESLAASQSHLWRAKSLLMCVFHNISPQRSSWQSNSYSSDIITWLSSSSVLLWL